MARALEEIKDKLKLVDIVLEIRDARAPGATGNIALDELLGKKSKLIVFNKLNLADLSAVNSWQEWFKKQGADFIFVNCFDKASLKKLITQARNIVEEKRKLNNPEVGKLKTPLRLMILGLPNTGKSTIINQFAGKNATKTADKPGQTRLQQWITIDKNLELLDTPGVMPPLIAREEHGVWLSAIHAIPDNIVGEEIPARYLVQHFLDLGTKEFLDRYKFTDEKYTLDSAIEHIAKLRGCIKQKNEIDFERVYKLILQDFRKGELGKTCFGKPN
jgi:ribosome biogenesis GTPase A